VEFQPDDKVVAATSGASGAAVWSTESWSELRRVNATAISMTFFGPELIILGNDTDKMISSWDYLRSDDLRFLHRFPTKVYCLRNAHEHPFYVAGGGSLHLMGHDGQLGRVLSGSSARVQALALSPHDRRVVAGSFDGKLRFYNLASDEPAIAIGPRSLTRVNISERSPWVVISDNAYGMWAFDARTGERIVDLPGIHGKLLSASGKYLIAIDPQSGFTHLLQMPTADTVAVLGPIGSMQSSAFSLDESTLAIANADGATTIYDVPSGQVRGRVQFESDVWEKSREVYLNEHGSTVACRPSAAFDTHSGKSTDAVADPGFFGRAIHEPGGVTYSPDGTMTATMEDIDGVMVLLIRDSRTRRQLHSIRHPISLAGWQCWSPDGRRVAVLTANHVVVLIDPRTGLQVAELDHCSAPIITLNFTADGQALRALTKTDNGRLEWYEWQAPREAPITTARAR
jgi:WD40 repeat protein